MAPPRSTPQAAMDKVVMPVPTRDEIRHGIFYMIAAVFLFSIVNAIAKWQGAGYPVLEVVFFRCLFSLVPSLAVLYAHGGPKLLATRRLPEHIGRGAMQFVSTCCIFFAFQLMPLADVVAITFSSPLFLTVLSIPLLGEKVGRHRWGAVLVGFTGVLIMVRPGAEMFSAGALLALANAGLGASVTIALRRMSLSEPAAALVTYQAAITTGFGLLCLPFGWVTPSWPDMLALAALGMFSGTGQFLMTQGFRLAPAAVLAPFSYTTMIWAMGLGYLFWDELPTLPLAIGVMVVAASGLYILYRETLRRPTRQPSVPAAAGGG